MLTASGASIVWTPTGYAFGDVTNLATNPFFGAMAQLVQDRSDLRRRDAEADVAPVLADLRATVGARRVKFHA